MSASNIEIVQQLYGAFATREVDAILNMLTADVEWTEPPNLYNPAAGSRRGHDGVDDDSVAVVGYLKCRVKATGRVYESDFVHLVTFRDGKVARFQEFFDTQAAGDAFR